MEKENKVLSGFGLVTKNKQKLVKISVLKGVQGNTGRFGSKFKV